MPYNSLNIKIKQCNETFKQGLSKEFPRARGSRFTSRSLNERFALNKQQSVVLERGATVVEVATTVT